MANYDFKFARKRTINGAEWALTGGTAGHPYAALVLTEADRDTHVLLILPDDARVTETVTGRRPQLVRTAIDNVRERARLGPLFDAP